MLSMVVNEGQNYSDVLYAYNTSVSMATRLAAIGVHIGWLLLYRSRYSNDRMVAEVKLSIMTSVGIAILGQIAKNDVLFCP